MQAFQNDQVLQDEQAPLDKKRSTVPHRAMIHHANRSQIRHVFFKLCIPLLQHDLIERTAFIVTINRL